MQAQLPENPEEAEFDERFAGTVFEPDTGLVLETDAEPDFEPPAFSEIAGAGIESSLETGLKTKTPKQLLLPVGVSIAVHICLLILLRQLMPGTQPGADNVEVQPPSIRISFRPRPAPPSEPQSVEQEEPPMPEPVIDEAPALSTEELPAQAIADQAAEETTPEPPSQSPRLTAPALLDVRDLIQNRAQNDVTARIFNNTNCDERQRRTDLIDCGDEDPNAQYNFAAAEQNATVEFFAELNLPADHPSNQPPDRTSGPGRTRASLQDMNGNLGAAPLIRSVLGQP